MNKIGFMIVGVLIVIVATIFYIRHHIKMELTESLKDKKQETISVILNRSHVSTDDEASSRQIIMNVGLSVAIHPLLQSLAFSYPLPEIDGGKATWLIIRQKENIKTLIGVTAQQWKTPKLLMPHNTPIENMAAKDSLYLYFDYLPQHNPDTVFESWKRIKESVGNTVLGKASVLTKKVKNSSETNFGVIIWCKNKPNVKKYLAEIFPKTQFFEWNSIDELPKGYDTDNLNHSIYSIKKYNKEHSLYPYELSLDKLNRKDWHRLSVYKLVERIAHEENNRCWVELGLESDVVSFYPELLFDKDKIYVINSLAFDNQETDVAILKEIKEYL